MFISHQLRKPAVVLLVVTHVLVTFPLEYCNVPYMGLPLRSSQKLQLAPNVAAWAMLGTARCSHVTPPFHAAKHWLLGTSQGVGCHLQNRTRARKFVELPFSHWPCSPHRGTKEGVFWDPSVNHRHLWDPGAMPALRNSPLPHPQTLLAFHKPQKPCCLSWFCLGVRPARLLLVWFYNRKGSFTLGFVGYPIIGFLVLRCHPVTGCCEIGDRVNYWHK